MTRKNKAIVNFLPVAVKHFNLLVKNLMAFTEDTYAKDIVTEKTKGKGLPNVDLLEIIPNFNETVTDFTFLSFTSRVSDIAFIKALAKSFPNCDYLEIGCLRGESLVNILPHTDSTVSLSLSHQEMRDMNFPETIIEIDSMLIKPSEKLTQIYHNSQTFDFSKLNKKFDLIFIDGDHTTDGVKIDTTNAFKLLKDENSIIIWHDFGNNYSDQRNDVIAGALLGAPEEALPYIYRVTNTLCGIYTKRKLNILPSGTNMVKPTKVFDLTVSARKI